MRIAYFLAVFLVLGVLASGTGSVHAQATEIHNISLYAHTSADSLILNTLTNWGSSKSGDPRNTLIFTLQPALGEELNITGTIFVTLYLSASSSMTGVLHWDISELKSTGEQVLVPGATADYQVTLDTGALSFNYGVGIIKHVFARGSSIQLTVHITTTSQATPELLWDDIRTPTNIKIPTINPLHATTTTQTTQPSYGDITNLLMVQGDPKAGNALLNFSTNVTDPFGGNHIRNASLLLTSTGNTIRVQPKAISQGSYMALYAFSSKLSQEYWTVALELDDNSGEKYSFDYHLLVTPFYAVKVDVTDSKGTALSNASLDVRSLQFGKWIATTDSSGLATIFLPSSEHLGSYNLTVTWHNVQAGPPTQFTVSANSTIIVRMEIFDPSIRLSIRGFPIPNAHVILMQGQTPVDEQDTGVSGTASFARIPRGNYTLRVQYLLSQIETPLNVDSNAITEIELPFPHQNEFIILIVVAVAASLTTYATRKRIKLYPQDFSYFRKLTTGGLPQACYAIIVGNSGSGKTVLLESFTGEHLAAGKGCLYVTNVEYPSKIRESMRTLGLRADEAVKNGKLLFIDSYSALGGATSTEEYSVSSHTDLTGLGMEISKGLQKLDPGADVYIDSLTPLLSILKMDYLLNFLQSIAARVKANGGKLCMTIGTGIEKGDLTKLEEASDCVIETQLQELRGGQRRRMRVKKMRGQAYIDKWTNFNVETEKGIVFLTRTKPSHKDVDA
jgi:KaiC/GvpD/RAD55 family RecA-like ATPase